jgi:ubiquitin-like-conjugating enzyme ATG3
MRFPNCFYSFIRETTVPCLRRAASLQYTDADEDAERLLSFGEGSTAPDGDEWVETHAGRKIGPDSAEPLGEIDDIPDVDGPSESVAAAMANMSISGGKGGAVETPDIDEIPDMEEDLEADDDEATAAPEPPKASGPTDP